MGIDNENMQLLSSIEDGMKIKNSHTFIVVPFYFEEKTFTVNNWWENEDRVLSDDGHNGELLYPYIMDFLQGNVHFKQNQNTYTEEERSKIESVLKQSLQIYRLKVDDSERSSFWKVFATSKHSICFSKKGNEKIEFTLYGEERSNNKNSFPKEWKDFYLPHLFISPIGNVGLLTFHICLSCQESSIEELKNLNYSFHKIQGDMHKCVCQDLVGEDAKKYRKYLQWHLEKEPNKRSEQTWKPESGFTWNAKAIIDMFLRDDETISLTWKEGVFPHKSYILFSTERTNLLTYAMVCGKLLDQASDCEIISELTRLARCVDNKYLLPHSNPSFADTYTKLYENIYAAAAIEGTAIITIPQKNNDSFIQNYHKTSVRKKYVWIYILVLLQRFTLMNLNRQLASFDASHRDEEGTNNQDIWDLLKIVRFVKVHSYFTDVSSYSHFYEYYQLCCRNLHLNETYQEIDIKTTVLNLSISHEKGEKEARLQKRLERLLAIFAIIQAGQIIFEETDTINKLSIIGFAIILGWCAPQILEFFDKKINKNSKK